jgi:TRAP-type transport system large permease protein
MVWFILIVFIVLLMLGMPVGFVMGLTALLGLIKIGDPAFLTMLPQKFFTGMDSFAIMAMPLFILVGDIMTRARLTERLVDFSNLFVGRMRGGLAQVNVVSSVVFGSISGSAAADTAALGSMFIPSMTREGYDKEFSTAITIASSIISPIIPPSMIFVIYGAVMGVSIAGLFAAGLVPGLLLGAALMVYNRFISARRNYPRHTGSISFKTALRTSGRAIWILAVPFIILGGILMGMFTPTEAAAIAVALAIFLGVVIYRSLTLKELFMVFYNNSRLLGVIGLCLSSAAVLAWILASEQIPQMVADLFLSITRNKYLILLLVNVLIIIVGMFMDITAALIIMGPILAPLAISVGVHPIHFGVMMCVNLFLGLITPPVGGCLFLAMAISNLSMGRILKELWPMLLIEFVILGLVIYIPEICMTIPTLLGYAE